jgi:GNAT superfamily N-acetyltransferase
MKTFERDGYRVTNDAAQVDVGAVHAYLERSYWSPGIPRSVVEKAIAGSLPFSLFHGTEQVGFARVITDRATFGYLADVYVLESHRGRGLAHWLMECVMKHPDLQTLRRFGLVTRDAHTLYEPFGFKPLAMPERHMERVRPAEEIYGRGGEASV